MMRLVERYRFISLVFLLMMFGSSSLLNGSNGIPAGSAEVRSPKSETVYFNTNSKKFHSPSCVWAKRCTRNCIPVSRDEALKQGGVACKVCGGR